MKPGTGQGRCARRVARKRGRPPLVHSQTSSFASFHLFLSFALSDLFSLSLSVYLSIHLSLSLFLCLASTLPFIIPSASHFLFYPCLYPTISVSLIPEFRSRGRLIMQGPFSIHLTRRNALLLFLSTQRRHSFSTRSICDVPYRIRTCVSCILRLTLFKLLTVGLGPMVDRGLKLEPRL